jgi:glycine/serine hydroxymethyltransferase
MGTNEMKMIGGWMADVLDAPLDENVANRVASQVTELTKAFPLYAAFRAKHHTAA